MLGKKVFELTELAFPIALWQDGADSYSVTYGKQEHCFMPYGAAATDLGVCIMHALRCEGRLDNEEEG